MSDPSRRVPRTAQCPVLGARCSVSGTAAAPESGCRGQTEPVDTRDDVDPDADLEPAPPTWGLSTPTRQREVWTLPVLTLVLAAVWIVAGVLTGRGGAVVCGALVAVGAVALAVTGRAAFSEQSHAASWRLHVARVVVGFGVVTVMAVSSLIAAISVGTVAGVLGAGSQVFRNARSVPRFDRLVAATTASLLAVVAAVLVVLGLVVPTLPEHRAASWVGAGWVVAVVAAVIAVVQFHAASRAPRA